MCDLGLPQLGLVLIVRQLRCVHAFMRAGLGGGGRGQQRLLLGEVVAGVVPAVRVLLLQLLLVLEEVFDLVGHVQEVFLGDLAALQTLTGLQKQTTTL